MKRNMIAKCLLLAIVALTEILGQADIPRQTYHYRALSYPEYLATKAGPPYYLGLYIFCPLLISLVIIMLNYIRVRRKSGSTFLAFMRKHQASNRWIFLLCLIGGLGYLRYVLFLGQLGYTSVEPSPNESYSQYRERVRRLENDLCLICGTKREHWDFLSGRARHSGCPKCDDLYGTCKECGKEFNRFDRGWHVYVGQKGTKDPNELCNACIKLHGIHVQ